MKLLNLAIAVCTIIVSGGVFSEENIEKKLSLIKLPAGFSISLYAQGVDNSRQLALGGEGTVFAGSTKAGKVHAVVDSDGDHKADRVFLIDDNLTLPSGVEFRDGSLFVAALDRLLRYDNIEAQLAQPPQPILVRDGWPDKTYHGWKYLRFGPDSKLYVPIGAPCNICDEPSFAQIRRLNVRTGDEEVFAKGLRNSVGMAFHPDSGELWMTDNGRDMLGDDLPADELNHAPMAGMHFGYPWCHQGDSPDPEFGEGKSCNDYTPPALKLGAHVASLGLTFYSGDMFPTAYKNQLFIAQHGSWNRSEKSGYNILLVHFNDEGDITGSDVFASGWLQGDKAWGRPNDVVQMPDGSLLVSDDRAGAIYRISYNKK